MLVVKNPPANARNVKDMGLTPGSCEHIFKGQVIQGIFSDHMELSLKSVTKRKNSQVTAH